MMTNEQIKAQRATLTARLVEVAEELREDRKSDGAKAERRALRKALKSLAACESLVREIEATKTALAALCQA